MEEDYSKWTIAKFCRLMDEYREMSHMAPNNDTFRVAYDELQTIESEFKRYHPRALKNYETRKWNENH